MTLVFDACAMIAYLRGEPGADIVENYLLNDQDEYITHAINVCEVYYDFLSASDEATAKSVVKDLRAAGIRINKIITTSFWQEAGKYKGTLHRVSLADCFAIALTNRLGGTLVTSDHHEFDPIAQQNICPIAFIR